MYTYVKRFIDIIGSIVFMIIFSPLMLVIYIMLKINLGGKMVYKQERYGLNRKVFNIYKFKTMHDDHSIEHNLRLTKFSEFVRKTGLDELPQLLNIFKGEMSLIGPRPFMVHDPSLPDSAHHPKRYKVKPGVLGMAQAKGRRWSTHDEKMMWDLKYVDEISFWTDFKLFFSSIRVVFIQLFK